MNPQDLSVLQAIAAAPEISQRQLAQRAGLSLAKAHFVLRRLIEKGLVKVKNAAHSKHKLGYLYLLTPKGLEAKARLTYRFMQRQAEAYRALVEQVEAGLDAALADAGPKPRVAILGDGPLAEVVTDLLRRKGAQPCALEEKPSLALLLDPDATPANGVPIATVF